MYFEKEKNRYLNGIKNLCMQARNRPKTVWQALSPNPARNPARPDKPSDLQLWGAAETLLSAERSNEESKIKACAFACVVKPSETNEIQKN